MAERRLTNWILGFVSVTAAIAGCSREVAMPLPPVQPEVSKEKQTVQESNFYTVDHYDKSRDPASDLAATIQRATAENKRILLQVGGDWCGWCKLISQYMHDNQVVNNLLMQHFVVMKVTYPGDHAASFLGQFPKCNAYPHFFVLEKDGTFLHSQGTGELEEGKGYNEKVFTEFLNAWVAK